MQWFSSRYDTKLILWTLFIIQLLLIGVFWMLQNLTTNDTDNNNLILGTSSIKKKFINHHNNNDDNDDDFRSINFVKQKNYDKFINAVVFRQGNNNSSSDNKLLSKGDGEQSKIKNENFFYYSAADSTKQQKIEIKSISNFSEDFITYNKLESNHNNNNVENLICYREGTTNILNNNIHYDTDHIIDNHNDINNLYKNKNNINDYGKCKCKQEWHGKDCGQPEIIWRALMTSKLPLKISDKPKLNPNKIIYMLIGNFLNYELLEIQIMELINIVDFFIICRKNILFNNNNNNNKNDNILMSDTITTNYYYYNRNDDRQNKRLKLNFVPDEYKNRFFIIDNNNYYYEMGNKKINKKNKNNYHLNNCTPKFIYKEFLKNLQNNKNNNLSEETINVIENNNNNNMKTLLNPNDIFIFSYDDEILNSKAIKYFKYYDKLPAKIIRFRLKYNVYGFFWQHPENTYLGSYGCNIEQFHNIYKMDPERLFMKNNNNNNQKLTTTKNHIIIGDLNHYGGWYCKYCYQPNEIIERLKIDAILLMNSSSSSSSSSSLSPSLLSIFPKNSKNQQIDVGYIQNLIASGLYVDGKLGLIKLHKYSDKYYTPNYVDKNYWKFNNIITNLYLSYLNDDGDDYM